MDAAYAADGTLAPEGPAWQALLVESSQNLTIDAAKKLKTWAEAGLPVILSGGMPGFYPFANGTIGDYTRELSSLSDSLTGVAQQLSADHIAPLVGVKTNGRWYTTWSEAGDVSYTLVYCDLVGSTGEVLVATSEMPYFCNARGLTAIIAFSDKLQEELPTPRRHVLSIPSNVLDVKYSPSAGLNLHVGWSDTIGAVCLSDDEKIPLELDLGTQHWEAPADLSDDQIVAVKRNTTHHLRELASWDKIPELVNVSGVGYYNTTFSWPPTNGRVRSGVSTLGAYLNVGRVTHALKIIINGQQLPPVDFFKAEADITPYLQNGEANEVMVVVPTTMWNYLRGILPDLRAAGSTPFPALSGVPLLPMDAGLLGPVTVVPYENMKV
ncbi:unnamed protein product [Clonostachys chloroleuca]|uniref:Uncharacterized protein n=1 Tax=Clonostachys chloroleuca TaxID=1926264 RepID=A0AA35M6G6_9HYPO|nr:unnamed protein product [Clonostachys chloroleuca]